MACGASTCDRGCSTGARSSGCASGGCSSGGACPAMFVFDWLTEARSGIVSSTFEIVEVTFKGGRTGFFSNTSQKELQTGDQVVVEADRGIDIGTVHMTGEMVRIRLNSMDRKRDDSFPDIVRIATLDDLDSWERIRESDTEAFLIGRRIIDRINLPMKLVDVEWQFDRKKVTFYFTAEHRVDFRELVRKLASRFRTRVEMRQIGARDEAARIGGIGTCGRELCCSTWLRSFKPVSTSAAKIQNLPLNPVRLSGQCGRLKCCLNYELEQYMTALKGFPRVDTLIQWPTGEGMVRKIDIFKNIIWVQDRSGNWLDVPLAEIEFVPDSE